jgi:hypothetical protein
MPARWTARPTLNCEGPGQVQCRKVHYWRTRGWTTSYTPVHTQLYSRAQNDAGQHLAHHCRLFELHGAIERGRNGG